VLQHVAGMPRKAPVLGSTIFTPKSLLRLRVTPPETVGDLMRLVRSFSRNVLPLLMTLPIMDLDRVKDHHHSVASREGHPEDAGAAAEQKQGRSKP
jgi:hypothetical protein